MKKNPFPLLEIIKNYSIKNGIFKSKKFAGTQ